MDLRPVSNTLAQDSLVLLQQGGESFLGETWPLVCFSKILALVFSALGEVVPKTCLEAMAGFALSSSRPSNGDRPRITCRASIPGYWNDDLRGVLWVSWGSSIANFHQSGDSPG